MGSLTYFVKRMQDDRSKGMIEVTSLREDSPRELRGPLATKMRTWTAGSYHQLQGATAFPPNPTIPLLRWQVQCMEASACHTT